MTKPSPTPLDAPPLPRAMAALRWASNTFGMIACDEDERALRFFEEAVELVHALEYPPAKWRLIGIIERCFSREPGVVTQEVGQAMLTLEMLAFTTGVDPNEAADAEFSRVQAIPKEEWERRHKEKVEKGIAK